MARVTRDSRVLDPTCGSCGLLLSAAALGATHLVGVDHNASAFDGCARDFERLALPPPHVLQGDLFDPEGTEELAEARYDAMVSDPPYNLRAPVLCRTPLSNPALTQYEPRTNPARTPH